jgi:tetratricopeptide (TPR) repeat protein
VNGRQWTSNRRTGGAAERAPGKQGELNMADLDSIIAGPIVKIIEAVSGEKKPDIAREYLKSGIARCCKGGEKSDYEKAIEDFSIAEKLGNSDEQLYYYRALAYYMCKEYARAEEVLKQIPDTKEPYQIYKNILLGDIYLGLKKYKESVDYYNKALEEYNDKTVNEDSNPTILLNAAVLQNYKKAKDWQKDAG